MSERCQAVIDAEGRFIKKLGDSHVRITRIGYVQLWIKDIGQYLYAVPPTKLMMKH